MKFVIDDEVVLSRPLEGPLAAHITIPLDSWTLTLNASGEGKNTMI